MFDTDKYKEKRIKNENKAFMFKVVEWIVIVIAIVLVYFNSSSFKRSIVDYKSDLGGGLERTINVYTANGDIIATYSGKIDLEATEGYVKFDLNGKRYIYYNCFVETIADID